MSLVFIMRDLVRLSDWIHLSAKDRIVRMGKSLKTLQNCSTVWKVLISPSWWFLELHIGNKAICCRLLQTHTYTRACAVEFIRLVSMDLLDFYHLLTLSLFYRNTQSTRQGKSSQKGVELSLMPTGLHGEQLL